MSREYHLRDMRASDREAAARLIYCSTNGYYESIGREPIFVGDELVPAAIFDVYQQLDAEQGIVAIDENSGAMIGLCFVHPRETHYSLGIMNVHPEHFGRGVARAILAQIVDRARTEDKPVRLVSSCLNLDSYSLYGRAGFVPFCTFQDMIVEVPEGGLAHGPPNELPVRTGTLDDADAMEAIEREVSGISRRRDYEYFLGNADGLWHVSVIESVSGVDGFLVSCSSDACNMIGPGVSRTDGQMAALVYAELNQHPGRAPVLLAPVARGQLVQQLYAWGARNCEMHVAQSNGAAQAPAGVVLPTFLPETG